MKKFLYAILLTLLFAFTASATSITVSSTTISNYTFGGSAARLRIVANNSFFNSSNFQILKGSISSGFYQDVVCTVASSTVTCPSFQIDSTTDSSLVTANYSAYLLDSKLAKRADYLLNFPVPHTLGSTITWAQIETNKNARPMLNTSPLYYTSDQTNVQIDQKVTTALAGFSGGGLTNGDKGDVSVASGGANITIDTNAVTTAKINDNAVTTAKINDSAVTSAKLSPAIDAALLGNGAVSNTELSYLDGATSNLQSQINAISSSTVPDANTVTAGKVTLSTSGTTTAIASNDAKVNAEYFADSFGSMATAISALGSSTPATLVVSTTKAISTTTITKNITLRFTNSAKLTVATGQIITIQGYIDAPANQQIFALTGTGKVDLYEARLPVIYPEWWGAKVNDGTDDLPAFNAMMSSVQRLQNSFYSGGGGIAQRIILSQGTYNFSDQWVIKSPVILKGVGYSADGFGTILQFATDKAGIYIDRAADFNYRAGDCVLEDFWINGGRSNTVLDETKTGLLFTVQANITRVRVRNFKGHGTWALGTGGSYQVSNSVINTIANENNNGDGLLIQGNDSSAIYISGSQNSENGGAGFRDKSFLGNTYVGNHARDNKGGSYIIADGQAVAQNVLVGNYAEDGQPPARLGIGTLRFGGTMPSDDTLGAVSGFSIQGGYSGANGTRISPFKVQQTFFNDTRQSQLYLGSNLDKDVLFGWSGSVDEYQDSTLPSYQFKQIPVNASAENWGAFRGHYLLRGSSENLLAFKSRFNAGRQTRGYLWFPNGFDAGFGSGARATWSFTGNLPSTGNTNQTGDIFWNKPVSRTDPVGYITTKAGRIEAAVTAKTFSVPAFGAATVSGNTLDAQTGFFVSPTYFAVGNGTCAPHTLKNGTKGRFTTTGSLPNGILANTDYYVTLRDGYCGINVSLTVGGFPAEQSGGGSGTLTFTPTASIYLTATGHPFATGDIGRFTTTGSLPTGLLANTDYYVKAPDANTLAFATSAANLENNVFVEITSAGSGTLTFTQSQKFLLTATAHGLLTGTLLSASTTGTLPAGLSNGGYYFVTRVDDNTIKLSSAAADDYKSDVYLPVTNQGTGTHTLTTVNGEIVPFGATGISSGVPFNLAITPAAIGAATTAEQSFAATGVAVTDRVICNPPSGMPSGVFIAFTRGGTNQIVISFGNVTAGSLTPIAGTYPCTAFKH